MVNPAAKTDPSSPIYGMPILDVENAKACIVNKRSMKPGYAGIENELLEGLFMNGVGNKFVLEGVEK